MASDDLLSEMTELFSAMLSEAMASRFSRLLAMKPERWARIDPWKVWRDPPFSEPHVAEVTYREALMMPLLRPHLDRRVCVLRCGHSAPSLGREPLRGVLDNSSYVLDGFVSIVRGKLGIAINHDGRVCTLHKL